MGDSLSKVIKQTALKVFNSDEEPGFVAGKTTMVAIQRLSKFCIDSNATFMIIDNVAVNEEGWTNISFHYSKSPRYVEDLESQIRSEFYIVDGPADTLDIPYNKIFGKGGPIQGLRAIMMLENLNPDLPFSIELSPTSLKIGQ